MELARNEWTIGHLRDHLQYAVDLELWTIPFYMSALFSIVDRTSNAFQLVQSIVNQEMLHLQMAANLANSWGLSPAFDTPVYHGEAIPHLNFDIDVPDPRRDFVPYSAEIGPLDAERVNAMCLIEFLDWKQETEPDLHDDITEYGSIGAFYAAVAYGASLLEAELRGGVNQVDHFSAFYGSLPALTVSENGEAGYRQAALLIDVITDQGEGYGDADIAPPYRNTADDGSPALAHFTKFMKIRSSPLPAVYMARAGEPTDDDRKLRRALVAAFDDLRCAMTAMFSGGGTGSFLSVMITVGALIQTCWQRGVVPRFSDDGIRPLRPSLGG